MEFSEAMKYHRMSRGMDITDLADLTGVIAPSLYSYEAQRTFPNINSALKISRVLNFSLDSLELSQLHEKTRVNEWERAILRHEEKIKELRKKIDESSRS